MSGRRYAGSCPFRNLSLISSHLNTSCALCELHLDVSLSKVSKCSKQPTMGGMPCLLWSMPSM